MPDEQNGTPPARQMPAPPKPQKPEIGERVGRSLGKAFLKLKKSRVWQETKKNYQDGIEGR